jgi:hypothetical protein
MIKKLIALMTGSLLAIQIAGAQTETGTSAGARSTDMARSEPISAGSPAQASETAVVIADGKSSKKTVVVEEAADKWWSISASTGWDSLYMFRGVNVLGNGNGIYWVGGEVNITPWENGTVSTGIWYGVGSWWNGANAHSRYGELDIYADYTHTFGNLSLTAGWIYYYYTNVRLSSQRDPVGSLGTGAHQNEIYFGASYNIEIGSVTLTPNTTYYYNVGPELGSPGGIVNGGSSYWSLGLNASVPVGFDGAVSLAPYTQFNLNFGFNNKDADINGISTRTNGGNNWQTGVALPIAFTSWLTVSPYLAYSYQWNTFLAGPGTGTLGTAVNTFWGGISATVTF